MLEITRVTCNLLIAMRAKTAAICASKSIADDKNSFSVNLSKTALLFSSN